MGVPAVLKPKEKFAAPVCHVPVHCVQAVPMCPVGLHVTVHRLLPDYLFGSICCVIWVNEIKIARDEVNLLASLYI